MDCTVLNVAISFVLKVDVLKVDVLFLSHTGRLILHDLLVRWRWVQILAAVDVENLIPRVELHRLQRIRIAIVLNVAQRQVGGNSSHAKVASDVDDQ